VLNERGGQEYLGGRCCVETSVRDDNSIELSAVNWRDCIYHKKHPDGLTEHYQCGPWVNIRAPEHPEDNTGLYAEVGDGFCRGGYTVAVVKTGEGTYRGNNFAFTWRETK
jgi:hypothetical protein